MIIDYIYSETNRQHRDNFGDFAKAHQIISDTDLSVGVTGLWWVITGIGFTVEPEVNRYRHVVGHYDNFRACHVGFVNGGNAAPVMEVRPRMIRLLEIGQDLLGRTVNAREGGPAIGMTRRECDQFVKMFLDIHPFVDGNGRTASILRNWMLGLLQNPQPLPYYYDGV
jgi:hypothetical protein